MQNQTAKQQIKDFEWKESERYRVVIQGTEPDQRNKYAIYFNQLEDALKVLNFIVLGRIKLYMGKKKFSFQVNQPEGLAMLFKICFQRYKQTMSQMLVPQIAQHVAQKQKANQLVQQPTDSNYSGADPLHASPDAQERRLAASHDSVQDQEKKLRL